MIAALQIRQRLTGMAQRFWHRVCQEMGMTNAERSRRRQPSTEPTNVLVWVFQSGTRHLTCQIARNAGTGAFDVATVPHWDVAASAIESFSGAPEAFQRHAVIASTLRQSGWVVASYGSR
jgi:hypothetical protein